jgi:hypothetical protein
LEAQQNEFVPYFAKVINNIEKNHELMVIPILQTKDNFKIPT